MKDVPPSRPALITFRIRTSAAVFQSPSRAEAVAVGHQALHGDAGELAEPGEVLERVGERVRADLVEERPQAELDARGLAERVVPRLPPSELGNDVVLVLVDLHEEIDVGVLDAGSVLDQLADAVPVHGEAQADLGLHLVALGDRDVAHVVAEAGDAQPLGVVPAARRAGPGADAPLDPGVVPMPDDGLPPVAQSRREVAELAVAVRRLVQVHEVHVDLRPRQLEVVLRVQVQQRLRQGPQPGDPHLGRRERVHPRDDPDAARVRVRLQADPLDGLRRRQHRLGRHAHRDGRRIREPSDDLGRLLLDRPKRILPIQALAPGQEPDREFACIHRQSPSGRPRKRCRGHGLSARTGAGARRGSRPRRG